MQLPDCIQQRGGRHYTLLLGEAAYGFKVQSGTRLVSRNGTDPRWHHYVHIVAFRKTGHEETAAFNGRKSVRILNNSKSQEAALSISGVIGCFHFRSIAASTCDVDAVLNSTR